MKKLSLYWKTWLITVSVILLSITIFITMFLAFTSSFLTNIQKNKINSVVNKITETIETDGLSQLSMQEYLASGYSICLVYDTPGYYQGIPVCAYNSTVSASYVNEISSVQLNNEILYQNVKIEGMSATVGISYPTSLNDNDVQYLFKSITPYFIIIGVIIASIASMIYAKYFTKKIDNINGIITEMAIHEYPIMDSNVEGDEIQELENSLNLMYHQLHDMLESLDAEIKLTKRLEADRQLFMRGAVHELKTPIMNLSTILESMLNNNDISHDDVGMAYERIYSMNKLVKEILDISKLENIKTVGSTALDVVIEDVLDVYAYMAQDKGLKITVDVKDVSINIPKHNIEKVMSNLLGNSIRYSPNDSEIIINVSDESISIKNETKNNKIYDKEDLIKPFTSFDECSDEYGQSNGLGLYIVDSILNHYDYKYSIDTDANVFTVSITI